MQGLDWEVPQRGAVDRDRRVGLEDDVPVRPQVQTDMGADDGGIGIAVLLDLEAVLVAHLELGDVTVDGDSGVVGLDHSRRQDHVDGQVLDHHLVAAAVAREEHCRRLVASVGTNWIPMLGRSRRYSVVAGGVARPRACWR